MSAARVAAASGDAQTAEALFQSGKEAMARGDLAVACARFSESVSIDPAAGSLLNLADCEERSGKVASALAHFQAARDRLRADDPRTSRAAERIAQLQGRAPRLTIVVQGGAPNASVIRDETPLGAASLGVALPVDPGLHVLVLRAPGRAERREEVTLREGESRTIELVPGAPTASSDAAVAHEESAGGTQRTIGIVLGAGGLVAIAGGSVMGVLAKSTYDDAKSHCPAGPHACDASGVDGGDRAYGQATASTILFVAGGALVATGLTLFLTAPRVAVTPVASEKQAGLAVVGAW